LGNLLCQKKDYKVLKRYVIILKSLCQEFNSNKTPYNT
jgi:hypothetical protein